MQQDKKTKTICNYQLGKTLGEGTFGKVKLAVHKPSQQKVAIKILQKQRIVQVADVQRVSRQIHILKIIRHPNLIQLYEIIQTPKQLFLVMQYASCGQLFDLIVKNKRLKQAQACHIFQQLISGIQYIHKLNIVHRDLKPQNLLIDFNNTLKIVDFGLSNTFKKGFIDLLDQMVKTGCGSPCYAAPEMIEGLKYHGPKVDIWSCGVILFAMVSGYLPFQDQNTAKLYQKILKCQFIVPKFLSGQVKDLLTKILVVQPQKRYSIQQIRSHKWWQLNKPNYNNQGIIVGYNRIPCQQKILSMLPDLNISPQYTRKCIQANRHNSATTCYHLLLKKFCRQGNHSGADIASQNFDRQLIQPIKRRVKEHEQKKQKRNTSLPRSRVGSTGQSYNQNAKHKIQQNGLMLLGKNQIKIETSKRSKLLNHIQVKQLVSKSKTPNSTKPFQRRSRYQTNSPLNPKTYYKKHFNQVYQTYQSLISRSKDTRKGSVYKQHPRENPKQKRQRKSFKQRVRSQKQKRLNYSIDKCYKKQPTFKFTHYK